MSLTASLATIVFAALIHASFQLSVSVLTLMSGHALGKQAKHTALMRLVLSYVTGAGIMTMLFMATVAYTIGSLLDGDVPVSLWTVCCGLTAGVGLMAWRFYYRKGQGTSLWLPRPLARYLSNRSKATDNFGEAFGLGLSGVAAEAIFVIAPIAVAALAIIHLSPPLQLAAIALYTTVSLLPLLIVGALVGGGHRLSRIQQWRETNKPFLQFIAGGGLLILSVYIYVEQVMTATVATSGGM